MLIKNSSLITKQGFTLIELIIVVVILGIVGINVIPVWISSSTNLNLEVRRLLQDIRYTQALSVTAGQRYRWVKLSSSTYQIVNEAGSAITFPSGETQVGFSNNISFDTLSNLPNNLLAFDSQGTPYVDTTFPGTALASAATISLTTGSVTRVIQISPGTGFGALQ